MKNKSIREQYEAALKEIKLLGIPRLRTDLEELEKNLKKASNLYSRIGILGRIALVERALKDLGAL